MPSTWAGRLRGHTLRAAAASITNETRNAFVDKVFAARSAYVDVPDMLVRAAVTRNIRIPRNLADAQASPEWPRWKAAIEKEICGLIRLGVYNEVNRNDATTKVVPTQMIFDSSSTEASSVDSWCGETLPPKASTTWRRDHQWCPWKPCTLC